MLGVAVELFERLLEQLAEQRVVQQLLAGLLRGGEVRHLVVQFEDITQLRPLVDEVDHAAVVLLKELAQHEDGKELGTGEITPAVLARILGKRLLAGFVRGPRNRLR